MKHHQSELTSSQFFRKRKKRPKRATNQVAAGVAHAHGGGGLEESFVTPTLVKWVNDRHTLASSAHSNSQHPPVAPERERTARRERRRRGGTHVRPAEGQYSHFPPPCAPWPLPPPPPPLSWYEDSFTHTAHWG
jgi:hypothetical protein